MNGQLVSVRFKDAVLVGRALEPVTALADGQQLSEGFISVAWYNDLFLKITFLDRSGKAKLSQYVPWAQVGTVIFDETSMDEGLPSRAEVESLSAMIANDAMVANALADRDVAAKRARGRPRKV